MINLTVTLKPAVGMAEATDRLIQSVGKLAVSHTVDQILSKLLRGSALSSSIKSAINKKLSDTMVPGYEREKLVYLKALCHKCGDTQPAVLFGDKPGKPLYERQLRTLCARCGTLVLTEFQSIVLAIQEVALRGE